jgi:uncharacterized protein YggE
MILSRVPTLPASILPLVLVAMLGAAVAQDTGGGLGEGGMGGMMGHHAAAEERHRQGSQERFISVVGHGVVHGQPDIAQVDLGVSVANEDVQAAVAQLDERISAVLNALAELGVPERKIRTVSYNIYKEERYPQREGGGPATVFRARHMLAVELQGARRAGEVLAAAVEAGANAVDGIVFGFSNPGELEGQARDAAVADARLRAEQLAKAAGVTLAEPVVIEEVNGGQGPMPLFERAAAVRSDAQVAPGELSVEVSVAIRYRIEQDTESR